MRSIGRELKGLQVGVRAVIFLPVFAMECGVMMGSTNTLTNYWFFFVLFVIIVAAGDVFKWGIEKKKKTPGFSDQVRRIGRGMGERGCVCYVGEAGVKGQGETDETNRFYQWTTAKGRMEEKNNI